MMLPIAIALIALALAAYSVFAISKLKTDDLAKKVHSHDDVASVEHAHPELLKLSSSAGPTAATGPQYALAGHTHENDYSSLAMADHSHPYVNEIGSLLSSAGVTSENLAQTISTAQSKGYFSHFDLIPEMHAALNKRLEILEPPQYLQTIHEDIAERRAAYEKENEKIDFDMFADSYEDDLWGKIKDEDRREKAIARRKKHRDIIKKHRIGQKKPAQQPPPQNITITGDSSEISTESRQWVRLG